MERPRVICHMMASIDGRIVTDGWPVTDEEMEQYEAVHESYNPDGWICGRVTMQLHFAQGVRPDADVAREHRGGTRDDFTAPGQHDSYAFALDANGRLAWSSGDIEGDHVVAILSERVSDEYLASLRATGVSYLLAGANDVDLALALHKIHERLGVKTLMLEGGGKIDGGMLEAGLIDEVSLLVAPVADGRIGSATLFDVERDSVTPQRLSLEAVERRGKDLLWLRYSLTAKS